MKESTTATSVPQNDQCDRAGDERDHEADQLFNEPWPERLGRETVLMFAVKQLINSQRKTQHRRDKNVAHGVDRDLKRFEFSPSLGKIAQSRRQSRSEKQDRDR